MVTVICWAGLVVPVVCMPKESEVGERVTAAAVPVPVSATVTVGAAPPKETVNVPVRVPAAAGVEVTCTSHLSLAAMALVQSLVWEKSPVMEMVGVATAASP